MAENFKPKTSGWILKHFDITRGKLEKYDELISPETRESQKYNKNQYREYQYEDIEKLWYIHMLSQMGMQMKEIKELSRKDEIVFRETVIKRIEALEAEKRRIEGMISIAKMCRATGSIPMPTNLIETPFATYREKVWRDWRCDDSPADKLMIAVADHYATSPADNVAVEKIFSIIESEYGKKLYELSEEERKEMHDSVPRELCEFLELASIERELVQLFPLDVSSEKVKSKVALYCACFQRVVGEEDYPLKRVAYHMAAQLYDGDASVQTCHRYGQERQEYMARAFEYYADNA